MMSVIMLSPVVQMLKGLMAAMMSAWKMFKHGQKLIERDILKNCTMW